MRELVFTLDYEPGCNAVADTVAEHPDARIRSLSLHATPESLWRVDHVTGGEDARSDIEAAFLTADYYADCLATEDCGATQTTQVLEHGDDTLVLYTYWERTPTCASVPHIALENLGDGILFETRQERREYTWRIIHSDSGNVRAFFEAVEAAVGDCAEMEIDRLSDASPPKSDLGGTDGLSAEQEAALQAAVEYGYYETPRKIDAGELAARLDIPRSTLTYRLRRVEAQLAKRHAARKRSTEGPSALL
jgi:predicted DNA binding protein